MSRLGRLGGRNRQPEQAPAEFEYQPEPDHQLAVMEQRNQVAPGPFQDVIERTPPKTAVHERSSVNAVTAGIVGNFTVLKTLDEKRRDVTTVHGPVETKYRVMEESQTAIETVLRKHVIAYYELAARYEADADTLITRRRDHLSRKADFLRRTTQMQNFLQLVARDTAARTLELGSAREDLMSLDQIGETLHDRVGILRANTDSKYDELAIANNRVNQTEEAYARSVESHDAMTEEKEMIFSRTADIQSHQGTSFTPGQIDEFRRKHPDFEPLVDTDTEREMIRAQRDEARMRLQEAESSMSVRLKSHKSWQKKRDLIQSEVNELEQKLANIEDQYHQNLLEYSETHQHALRVSGEGRAILQFFNEELEAYRTDLLEEGLDLLEEAEYIGTDCKGMLERIEYALKNPYLLDERNPVASAYRQELADSFEYVTEIIGEQTKSHEELLEGLLALYESLSAQEQQDAVRQQSVGRRAGRVMIAPLEESADREDEYQN